MPHSEAVQELIAAAKEEAVAAFRVSVSTTNAGMNKLEDATARLRAAVAAVEAEEKPRRFCRQPLEASDHQIGGK